MSPDSVCQPKKIDKSANGGTLSKRPSTPCPATNKALAPAICQGLTRPAKCPRTESIALGDPTDGQMPVAHPALQDHFDSELEATQTDGQTTRFAPGNFVQR